MEYEFLDHFSKRMKNVAMYTVLLKNSMQKTTWKSYGIDKVDEQVNIIFAVLLFIMEQSLKDEPCTIDDIGNYVDHINSRFFKKDLSYEMSKKLGEFIINVVLCDEGHAMYFDCFDFSDKAYQIQNISYVGNKIIYIDTEVRRTSYYLTDDGYNLLLGTLEIENNMKITIHEMIFKMHLEKAAYDKAVDDIKNVFNLLRIQYQKMQEAMRKIRMNALNYSVEQYREIMEENIEIISDTKKKFIYYRELVNIRVNELEEENINVEKLDKKGEDNLRNLKTIDGYLKRTLDEHQKILNTHFDLKSLYTKELEQLSQMVLIKRFNIRNDLYAKVLEDSNHLANLDYFLRPLFNNEIDKVYNMNKAFEIQKPINKKQELDVDELFEVDDDTWQEEQRKIYEEKIKKYANCLDVILINTHRRGSISLAELKNIVADEINHLIPTVEIFREVVVELLKSKTINIDELRKERSEYMTQTGLDFQINEVILNLIDESRDYGDTTQIETIRIENNQVVVFENVDSDTGKVRRIRCSDILFVVKGANEWLTR